jgi:hypothetical protein
MEGLGTRAETLGKSLALLAAYAGVVGALSVVTNLGGVIEGEVPAICRVALGLFGVVAGAMLWTGTRIGVDGWRAVMIWAVIQIPLYAWNADGSPFVQMIEVPMAMSSETSVNGETTSYSQVGINLVGVALAAWAASRRERWTLRGPRVATAA